MLFLLAAVRLLNDRSALQLGLMLLWILLVSVTKYTYMPFAVAGGAAVIVFLVIRDRRARQRALWADAFRSLSGRRTSAIALGIALLVALALFVERIVGNYLNYGDADPDCDVVRSRALCMGYDIFRRNQTNEATVTAGLASGELEREPFAPLAYTGTWLNLYYRSTYFYRGFTSGPIGTQQLVFGAAALLMILVLVAFILNRKPLLARTSTAAVFVITVVSVYLVSVYFFNARTATNWFQYYAHFGRYTLISLAFLYAFGAVAMVRLWRRAVALSAWLAWPLLGFVLVVVVVHAAPVSFLESATSPQWYSDMALSHLPGWITDR
jgi:hypothetical protein